MKYGVFYDLTGKGDFRLNKSFPVFIEKKVAELYLNKYVNITGIHSFFVMEIKKA